MAYGQNAPFGLRPTCGINGGAWTEKTNEYEIYASADGTSTYATSIFTGDPVVFGTSAGVTPTVDGAIGTIARYNPSFTDQPNSLFSAVPVLGVFNGCEFYSIENPSVSVVKDYWPASTHVVPGTKIKAFIYDGLSNVYDVQVSTHVNANANDFVALPEFPNINVNGGAPFPYSGSYGRNFGLNVGGGSNFSTILPTPFANNPATGSTLTGQSAFYLDVSTVTGAGLNHDYVKSTTTLPVKVIGYSLNVQNLNGNMASTPFVNVRVVINNHALAQGAAAPIYVA